MKIFATNWNHYKIRICHDTCFIASYENVDIIDLNIRQLKCDVCIVETTEYGFHQFKEYRLVSNDEHFIFDNGVLTPIDYNLSMCLLINKMESMYSNIDIHLYTVIKKFIN